MLMRTRRCIVELTRLKHLSLILLIFSFIFGLHVLLSNKQCHKLSVHQELSAYTLTARFDPKNDVHNGKFQPPVSETPLPAVHLGPPLPTRAFMITQSKDLDRNYTLSGIERMAGVLGLNSPVEVVLGQYNRPPWCNLTCDESHDICQLGLASGLLNVWRIMVLNNIASAYVFEDDAIFHDNFDVIFPVYWSLVPRDFQVVYMGKCDIDATSAINKTVSSHIPFCTTAMVFSLSSSQRLYRIMSNLFEQYHNNRLHLTAHDIKPDRFMQSVHRTMLSDEDRSRWVSFNNLPGIPATWGNRSWLDANTDEHNCFARSGCSCEEPKSKIEGHCTAVVPVKGNGLVFQNVCKQNMSLAERWRQRPLLQRVFSNLPVEWHDQACPWWLWIGQPAGN